MSKYIYTCSWYMSSCFVLVNSLDYHSALPICVWKHSVHYAFVRGDQILHHVTQCHQTWCGLWLCVCHGSHHLLLASHQITITTISINYARFTRYGSVTTRVPLTSHSLISCNCLQLVFWSDCGCATTLITSSDVYMMVIWQINSVMVILIDKSL